MTVTVKFKTRQRRWIPNLLFYTDVDDIADLVFDYSGELGSDTIDTAEVTTNDVTAGTPVITNNSVSVTLNGFREGSNNRLEMKITTTTGNALNNAIKFSATDYFRV